MLHRKQRCQHNHSPIIGFTPNRWDSGWSSRRRILSGLAERGWPAIYSSGALTVWERGSSDWSAAPWWYAVEYDDRLCVDRPGKLMARWPTRSWYDRVALSVHAAQLKRAIGADASRPPIALLFHPVFWPYVRHLRPRCLIYYSYDAHRLAPGWTHELARYEANLVEAADLIAAFSQGMLDHMPGDAALRGRVLPTGVDVEPFEASDSQPCPEDLARISRPRIGYVGRVNQKLDHALILGAATRRPDWQWVFVGRVGAYPDGRFAADEEAESLWRKCIALPNVHTLGNKSHDDVPRYMRHMDLNVLCYRTGGSGWWSEIFPVKSLEYLAAGRPIVSTPVKSLRTFSNHMAFGSTVDEWLSAIERGLRNGGPGTEASRRAVARSNTWDDRINCLEGWMLDLARTGRVSPRAE